MKCSFVLKFFFFNDTATTEIYTLSLHDALPIQVTCLDLAFMAATLANGGVHPRTGKRTVPADEVQSVLSIMATCGMYDYAGSWLYEVGLPAKSGVSGGVIAVMPGRAHV